MLVYFVLIIGVVFCYYRLRCKQSTLYLWYPSAATSPVLSPSIPPEHWMLHFSYHKWLKSLTEEFPSREFQIYQRETTLYLMFIVYLTANVQDSAYLLSRKEKQIHTLKRRKKGGKRAENVSQTLGLLPSSATAPSTYSQRRVYTGTTTFLLSFSTFIVHSEADVK